ncbi:MAG TPA: LemA family protein [Armatimonadota bacterium]|nr:LemA family protein [Armatimonadota bacterium]
MGDALAIVLGLICCLGLAIVGGIILMYNGLITLRGRAENAWSQIDVQLRRRYDLIPNLVETVKGYAKHESQTLEAVIAARNTAMNASTVGEQAVAENALTQTLRSLFALSEAYPDLKANQNFLALQEELSGTESMIARSRQFYNDCTMDYNNKIQMFPHSILANMFHFTEREFFKIDEPEARGPVHVSFS